MKIQMRFAHKSTCVLTGDVASSVCSSKFVGNHDQKIVPQYECRNVIRVLASTASSHLFYLQED